MNHITTELVEAVAAARVNAHAAHYGSMPEADRAHVPDFALKTWDEQDPMTKHNVRETVLNQLNEITPHLIEAGWLPPAMPEDGRSTYTVKWSEEDGEYVATTTQYPSISSLEATPAAALSGLMETITTAEDMD